MTCDAIRNPLYFGFGIKLLHAAGDVTLRAKQSCVCNRVLMTSNGCVAAAAIPPLTPADTKYHGNTDLSSEDSSKPMECLKDSFAATRILPKGKFIASVVGRLRKRAAAPSRRRMLLAASKLVAPHPSCIRCFTTSAGVRIKS
jgi:hypothetical protein